MSPSPDYETVEVTSSTELRQWFEVHHQQPASIWLVTYKKAVPDKYLSAQAVLDEALCFGWIDGRRRKLDDQRTLQLLSPRKTGHWSKTYKDRVAQLTAAGRMHPAGLAAVAAAKASGMWDFLNDVDALIVPTDLAEALAAQPPALAHYSAFPPSAQRDILRWIKLAKTTTTRSKRIQKTVALAAENKRASGTR